MSVLVLSRPLCGLTRQFVQCRFRVAKKERKPVRVPPKKPLSGYQLFTKECLSTVVKEYPDIKLSSERMKIAASRWNATDSDTKRKYTELAEQGKETYCKERDAFMASLSEEELILIKESASERQEGRRQRKFRAKLKELEKPKGPRTAFNFYCKVKAGDTLITDKIKEIAESWKGLSEEEKQVFIVQAEEDKVRYEEQMVDWEAKMEKSGHHDILEQFYKMRHPAYLRSAKENKILNQKRST
ncbi:transcription factor A, mitochondrial-like [Ornithodoros turicata]|uniref:transcription factor A, mitochondrial-like n=1 Tax=Ornithodoros turicata TaxID=34597 RepID=UPI003139E36F